MEFELLLLELNEIIHNLLRQYKEGVIGGEGFGDITTSELLYVEAIHRLERPTVTELAVHLKVSKASTTLAVQKLIKKGIVEKTPSTDDKRSFTITLSGRGAGLIEAEMKALQDVTGSIRILLNTEEIELTTTVLRKIIAHYRR